MNPLEAVEIYKDLVSQLPEMIKKSGYKDKYIYEKMKLSKAVFYRRVKTQSWTVDEVEEILRVLGG